MVKFHVKKNEVEFIIEFPLDTTTDIIIETAANVSNQIYKLQRICSLIPDLVEHGPFRSEEYRVFLRTPTHFIFRFIYYIYSSGPHGNMPRGGYSSRTGCMRRYRGRIYLFTRPIRLSYGTMFYLVFFVDLLFPLLAPSPSGKEILEKSLSTVNALINKVLFS